MARLLELSGRASEASSLMVLGRCGCNACPTVFFRSVAEGAHEQDIGSWHGVDAYGGVVGVALTEEAGELTQLEVFTLDGHEPWGLPAVGSVAPISSGEI